MLQLGRYATRRARLATGLPLRSCRRSFALDVSLLDDLSSRGLLADITRFDPVFACRLRDLLSVAGLRNLHNMWKVTDDVFMPELILRQYRYMLAISCH